MKKMVVSILLGATIGIAGSYLLFSKKINDLTAKVDAIPPMVVVDFALLATKYVGLDQDEIEAILLESNNDILKLKNAGFLVIDGSSVIGAPDDLYLPLDKYQPKYQSSTEK